MLLEHLKYGSTLDDVLDAAEIVEVGNTWYEAMQANELIGRTSRG